MTWTKTWENILQGGPSRWKVDNLEAKQKALRHILGYTQSQGPLKIICPLAGDDPFVQYAWSQGHDVTAIDLVPAAVKVMREQFGGSELDWTKHEKESSTVVWKHASGRATLYEGDMLAKRPELNNEFDAVYDKDSFGALDLKMRQPFCNRLSEYCKGDAIVYIEVKNKESGREFGPPYHVEKVKLMELESFGTVFTHLHSLGEVYPLQMPGMSQTGHILQRRIDGECSSSRDI
eukprot:CAMPEP_0198143330 /NCGR_PEP_ID=MMETSP1443-20131203/6427_1 /TAXON_ID=186043 /ORGANISM="Entomoneis sp., Strain CCMP2396" /LENGTH=233 /DNA_ID=CAMNT_0043806551 /DNA_START=57 /DNA_END=758 /DNA_ORIENTATION=+